MKNPSLKITMNEDAVINVGDFKEIAEVEHAQLKGTGLVKFDSLINLFDCSFHSMGQSLISEETILPLYISNFTNSKLIIGLIPFIQSFLFSLPQLFTLTKPIKRFKSLKEKIIFWGILERLPWLILGIITLFISKNNPVIMLGSFFFFYAIYAICWGYPIPLWFHFIKNTIAEQTRGSFFGTVLILKNVFGLIGGIFLSFILNAFHFPFNYSLIFITAFIIMSISLLFFSLNNNSIKEEINPKESGSTSKPISSLFLIFKDDTEFLFLSLSFIFSTMLFTIIPFFTLYAKEEFNFFDSTGGLLTAIFFGGQLLGSILGGYLSNKNDYKKTMIISLASGMVTIIIVMFSKTMMIYYMIYFFVGLSLSTRQLSFLAYVMSTSSKEDTSVYIAITNNIIMPFQISFPLLAGLIIEYSSYNILFHLTLSFLLLSLATFLFGSVWNKSEYILARF